MYRLMNNGALLRLADGAVVPPVEGNVDYAAYLQMVAGGYTPEPPDPPTDDELLDRFTEQAQARLDAWARTRRYDGILSLCSYATDPRPEFAAEGQRGVELRSATWAALYAVLAEVHAGTREVPADFAAVEPELPVLTWGALDD